MRTLTAVLRSVLAIVATVVFGGIFIGLVLRGFGLFPASTEAAGSGSLAWVITAAVAVLAACWLVCVINWNARVLAGKVRHKRPGVFVAPVRIRSVTFPPGNQQSSARAQVALLASVSAAAVSADASGLEVWERGAGGVRLLVTLSSALLIEIRESGRRMEVVADPASGIQRIAFTLCSERVPGWPFLQQAEAAMLAGELKTALN